MSDAEAKTHWPGLPRVRRAVLVVDLVESVRLMQTHEDLVIVRWQQFVAAARSELLPRFGGRLVKSLGDGMLISFEHGASAAHCALQLAAALHRQNTQSHRRLDLELRLGLHVADVVEDELDIYGAGVNLAARLAALGRPGDIVMSAEARDQLLPEIDVGVEDLGECYVKHLDAPIRAWRVSPASSQESRGAASSTDLQIPSVAIVPLQDDEESPGAAGAAAVAAVMADELATLIAGCSGLSVIARPSVSALAQRRLGRARQFQCLRVHFLVEVRCRYRGNNVFGRVALYRSDSPDKQLEFSVEETVGMERGQASDALLEAATAVVDAIAQSQVAGTADRHLPNVASYSLLLSSIGYMHRMSRGDSDHAKTELDELLGRHPRAPEVHAWSAKWHMLRVAQRWSDDAAHESSRATFHVRRALDANPSHALALAIHGQTEAYQHGNLANAESLITQAVACGPSEPLAWLFLSNLRAHQGNGTAAIAAAERAMKLSPLDPTRFLFEMFAAQAALCAGEYRRAQALASSSLRANRMHLPTYPPQIIASVLLGDLDAARQSATQYLEKLPSASAQLYASRFRGPPQQGQLFAQALREAGLPN